MNQATELTGSTTLRENAAADFITSTFREMDGEHPGTALLIKLIKADLSGQAPQRLPFVDGTPPIRGSGSQASRRARASPLKIASIT